MLGAWRAHGLDDVLRRAWRTGVVLCGPSAGSLCWFDEALSAFHGAPRGVRGLGLLPYSNCVHYDAEPARREEYHRFVGDGMRARLRRRRRRRAALPAATRLRARRQLAAARAGATASSRSADERRRDAAGDARYLGDAPGRRPARVA